MTLDFNVLARVAKLVALFGFFLPWVMVSCSGNPMIEGTGWEWMTGHLHAAGAFSSLQAQYGSQGHSNGLEHQKPAYVLIAAFAVITIGLLVSLVTRQRAAAAVMLVTALLGIGLSYGNFEYAHQQMVAEANRQGQGKEPQWGVGISSQDEASARQAALNAIQLEKKDGFWVTAIALIVAALFSALTLANVRLVQSSNSPPAAS